MKINSSEYEINSGTKTSQPPRTDMLTEEQEVELLAAIKALGILRKHPMPQNGTAFEAHLTISEEGKAVIYSFWEGALEEDAKLKDLMRNVG